MRTPRVEVEWRDAASPHHDAWIGMGEGKRLTGEMCRNVGYLIEKGSDWVVLAGGLSAGGDVCMRFAIPRGAVRQITSLEPPRGPKIGRKKP